MTQINRQNAVADGPPLLTWAYEPCPGTGLRFGAPPPPGLEGEAGDVGEATAGAVAPAVGAGASALAGSAASVAGAGEGALAGVSGSRDRGSDSVGVGSGVNSTGGRTGLCSATGLEARISTGPGLGDRSDGVIDETTEAAELAGGAIGAESGPGAGLIMRAGLTVVGVWGFGGMGW